MTTFKTNKKISESSQIIKKTLKSSLEILSINKRSKKKTDATLSP